MEPGFTYNIDSQEIVNLLKNDLYSNKNVFYQNRGKQNYEKYLGTTRKNNIHNFGCSFWEGHLDLYNYLNEVTYPRDPDYVIDRSWMKYYPEGSFSGLHSEQQDVCCIEDQHTNVILVDQSEDIVGGVIVIAGDSCDIDFKDPNSKGNLRERLYTRFLKTPGEAITWDEKAVHGVSKIEKGHRLVFVCTKIKMERQNG